MAICGAFFGFLREIMQGYMALKEASRKWGISERRINRLCLEKRIPGATKLGNMWAIPCDAIKPKDERIKSGKYIKESNKKPMR